MRSVELNGLSSAQLLSSLLPPHRFHPHSDTVIHLLIPWITSHHRVHYHSHPRSSSNASVSATLFIHCRSLAARYTEAAVMEVDSGSGAKSDPTSTMHAISSISSPSPTPPPHSVSSSLSTALELKAAATAAVAAGEWQKAIGKYVRIFAYVQGLRLSSNSPAAAMMALSGRAGSAEADVTAEQKAQIDDLLLSTNTNLALCYSKLAQHDRVIHFATKVTQQSHRVQGCSCRTPH